MAQIQPNEQKFNKWFRKNYDGWCKRVEPAMGMDPGFPDLVCLTPSGAIFCELKIGSIVDDVLWCSEVRPSQIAWHTELANAGGMSCFAVGVWQDGQWRVFLFDGVFASQWETSGFELGFEAHEIENPAKLYDGVAEFVADYLEV